MHKKPLHEQQFISSDQRNAASHYVNVHGTDLAPTSEEKDIDEQMEDERWLNNIETPGLSDAAIADLQQSTHERTAALHSIFEAPIHPSLLDPHRDVPFGGITKDGTWLDKGSGAQEWD